MESNEGPGQSAERQRADYRLTLTVADTFSRSAVGGYLYLVGWAATIFAADLHVAYPAVALIVFVAFLGIAIARYRLRPPTRIALMRAWIVRYTTLVIASTLIWTIVQAWILLDAHFSITVRNVTLIGTIAYATVFAHLYPTILRLAVGGIATLFVPTLLLLWIEPVMHPMAATLSLYAAYLAVAVARSHTEYQRRLDLHEALREQRDLFEHLSRTDALCGLSNRRHFIGALHAGVRDVIEGRSGALSLALIDIDHFKAVNDRHGHAAGDEVLKAFADRMQLHFAHAGSLIARVGGEEFAVIMPGVDESTALARAERFREAVMRQPMECSGMRHAVTTSIGVAAFDARRDGDEDGLYSGADSALYAAKRQGRNRSLALTAMATQRVI